MLQFDTKGRPGAMYLLWGLLFLTGIYPLGLAWRANRLTTLGHPLMWASLAWAAWTAAAWLELSQAGLITYVAVCLTGCSGVAVLGARRPGGGAWNFVVGGLLTVLLQPLATPRMEAAHWLFLTATLAVPLLNYLPTRLGAAAVLLGLGCGLQILRLMELLPSAVPHSVGLGLIAVVPWAAWALLRNRGSALTEFDRLWLAYRDRFGFVWGQRMREQFNRAAHHAGWPVVLRWGGLQTTADEAATDPAALLATLRAVLKRFGPEAEPEKPQGT
jgi:hypothetical protein